MLAGFLVIINKGSADANGFMNLFENYVESNRTRFADFEIGLEIYNHNVRKIKYLRFCNENHM